MDGPPKGGCVQGTTTNVAPGWYGFIEIYVPCAFQDKHTVNNEGINHLAMYPPGWGDFIMYRGVTLLGGGGGAFYGSVMIR